MTSDFLHGTVHEAAEDLQVALRTDPLVLKLWDELTPLGRNEFICWVDDAKQPATSNAPTPHRTVPRRAGRGKEAALLLARLHPPH